jgi:hypothetical protein
VNEWMPVSEIPPMVGEMDDTGRECSGPLLVYVADRGVIAFGECRMLRAGPKFKASGFLGAFNITHWMPLPAPPSTPKQGEGECRYIEDASVPGGYRLKLIREDTHDQP